MNTFKRIALASAFAALLPLAVAQAQRPQVSTVNVTPEEGRVRVSAVGAAFGLRVEVTDEAGDTVFEAAQVSDNGLDWKMTDSGGKRVVPGTYTVTASYTTPSGKVRKRIEQVLVTEEVRGADGEEKSGSQKAAAYAPNPQPLVDGGGAVNKVAKFTDADTLTSSSIIEAGGRVGIGTAAAPGTGLRLEVNGITRMTPGGNGGYLQFGTPNTETGLTWLKPAVSPDPAKRADIRFNGDRLTLAAGVGAGVPNNSGVVIDNVGKVGVGTLTPAYKLHVEGGSLTAVYGKSNTTGVRGDGTTHGVYGSGDIGVYGNGGPYGVYGNAFNGVYGNGNIRGVWGVGGSYGLYGTGGTHGVWGSGGHYGVYGLSELTGVYGQGGTIGIHGKAGAGGTAGYFEGEVQITSTLFVQGNVCANNIPCSSDARLKQNVTNLNYGLDQLMRLRPVSWRWKSEPAGNPQMGLVAQEVEKVLPELVLRDEDATKPLGLNYMALLPVAVKAIQEQQAQIRAQQGLIEQLRAQMARQQTRLRRQQEQLDRVKRAVRRK